MFCHILPSTLHVRDEEVAKMRKKSSEIWVGVFVVIGILLLVLLTLKVGQFQIGRGAGYLVNTYFDSAAGLDKNASVRVAGVHIGHVERVALEQGKAKVTFYIPPNVILYKDARAYLKSVGFLGEKYVEISPGTPGFPRVQQNDQIEQGAPPPDIEQMVSKMGAIREDIKEVTKPIGEVLKAVDPKKVEGMINNLNKFSNQLTGIGNDAKETIQKAKDAFSKMEDLGDKVNKGEGTLGKLMTDDSIYQDAKKTVEAAKEAVETLKNISETIERGEGTLGKLVKDESLYQEAKETLQSVKGMTEKVEKGEGTLGKLISDDTLVKEAEKTMKKVQKAAEGLEEQTPITVLGTIFGIFF
jgi:phospholipid/cholesterol/gamma-HCH transport system substrate-binding protein